MKKFFFFFIIGFILIVMQSIWRQVLGTGNLAPDFLFILIVYSGFYRAAFTGAILSFCLGFLADSLWGLQPGLFATVYTMIFFLTRLSGRRFYMRSALFQLLLILLMTLIAKFLELAVLSAFDISAEMKSALWINLGWQVLINGLLAVPLIMVLEKIEQKLIVDNTYSTFRHLGEF